MVRYDRDHKANSRAALVQGAAALFRRKGYEGSAIDELCASAGLTRGAFYAHFRSKADLFRAVLNGSHDLIRRLREREGDKAGLASQGVRIAQDYLNVNHRGGVLNGCSLAALAMDTVRGDAGAQAAYGQTVERVVAEFRRGGVDAERARAALALCVGGLLVGAACGEHPVGDRVANAARREAARLLGESQ
jgi:TetR/AcrR family transcriptional repressor of nem operon